jgi:hypothetical protein
MTIFVIPVLFWRKTYSAGSGPGAGRERPCRDAAKMEEMVDKNVAKNGHQETLQHLQAPPAGICCRKRWCCFRQTYRPAIQLNNSKS